MLISNNWKDYEILKCSNGKKLERWNKYNLLRPDPVITWNLGEFSEHKIDAEYVRSSSGGGEWKNYTNIPNNWVVSYKDLNFLIKEMGFKHTGLFPEQAVNWE